MGRVPEVVGRVWYDFVMLAPSSPLAPVSQLTASLSGSDIIHTDVMGSHVFILNSIKTAHDLLDMRSTIYSDRYGLNSDTVTGLLTLLYADSTRSLGLLWPHCGICMSMDVYIAGILTRPPRLHMDFNIGFLPYGPTWRHLRREFHINFQPIDLEGFRPFEQRAVHRLLRNFLASPNKFSEHLRQ